MAARTITVGLPTGVVTDDDSRLTDARRWVRTAKLVLLLDGTSARDADLDGDG